jgi:hypothetical protein
MIITFFPVGCRAGTPGYLLRQRQDRVAAWIGDPLSYAALISLLATGNPFTAGVMAWERKIDLAVALECCLRFVHDWLLGGADVAAVPFIVVVHVEPALLVPKRIRTAAHFAAANVHLGLGKAIRPYVHSRGDFGSKVAWQDLLNREGGWRIPEGLPTGLRFARRPQEEDARRIFGLICQGLQQMSLEVPDYSDPQALERALHSAVDRLNAEPDLWLPGDRPELLPPAAILVRRTTHETEYIIKFAGGRFLELCTLRTSPKKILRRTGSRGGGDQSIAGDFGRFARERRAMLARAHGSEWGHHVDCDPRFRDFLLRPHFAAEGPVVQSGIEHRRNPSGRARDERPVGDYRVGERQDPAGQQRRESGSSIEI